MEHTQWLDRILIVLAISIVGGGLFMLLQGVSAMNKEK